MDVVELLAFAKEKVDLLKRLALGLDVSKVLIYGNG